MTPVSKPLGERLQDLSPTEFENVVFDLVSFAGLRNVIWRTPGADGGRDIEGEIVAVDFSGYHVINRWYVECKRYQQAISWPTVREKIAYAENHQAHSLLLVTTSALSPQCKTEVSTWNARNRILTVRYWDSTTLEYQLRRLPQVLIKHGLTPDLRDAAASFVNLSQEVLRTVQSAYGIADLRNQQNEALETSAAIAELLSVRMHNAKASGKIQASSFKNNEDRYDWLKILGDPAGLIPFDRFALRSIASFIKYTTAASELELQVIAGTRQVTIPLRGEIGSHAFDVMKELALWGDIELEMQSNEIRLTSR